MKNSEPLTARERLERALAGEEVDRPPFSPFLAYVWEHFPERVKEQGQAAFLAEIGADPLWRGAPCPVKRLGPDLEVSEKKEDGLTRYEVVTPVGTLSHAVQHSEQGNTSFLVEHPLKKEEDFKVQLWIEEHTSFTYDPEPLQAHLEGSGREGLTIGMLLPRGKTAFQSLIEHHVGTEELIYATVDFPETVNSLLEVMVENDLKAARLAARSGLRYFLTWEDSSTQNYSPEMYRRYIAPEIEGFCSILEEAGSGYIQHACGHVRGLLPVMRENGVTAVESISPPPTGDIPLKEARSVVGDQMGIIGGIEPTKLLNLKLEELPPYVEQVIEDGSGGPFVLANSDSCPPGVTVEKFRRIAELVRGIH